jgi:hypothetical protein
MHDNDNDPILGKSESLVRDSELDENLISSSEVPAVVTHANQRDDSDSEHDDEDSEVGEDDSEDESSEEDEELGGLVDDPTEVAYTMGADRERHRDTEIDIRSAIPSAAQVDSAKEFFLTELLYRFDILEPDFRKNLVGTFRFEIKGESGGVWTVNINDDLKVVNEREEAEVIVSAYEDDFVNVVNGKLNPQLAILSKKLKPSGNLSKFLNVLELVSPMVE